MSDERTAATFCEEALAEIVEAEDWFIDRNPAACVRFVENLDAALDRIERTPTAPPFYIGTTRAVLVTGFKYVVVYVVLSDRVEVIALAHTSRKPGYWADRI